MLDCLNTCNLVYLGFHRSYFIWINKHDSHSLILEYLDHIMEITSVFGPHHGKLPVTLYFL